MSDQVPRMLVVAPHPDDSILGAGGTMARFTRAGGEVTVLTIAAPMPPLFSEEMCRRSVEEARRAHAMIGVKESVFLNKAALSLQRIPHEALNKELSDALASVCPNVLIVPYLDRNVDHRVVFQSLMVASRPFEQSCAPSVVAAYEILSSTHCNAPHLEPNFVPTWVVDITEYVETKLEMLRCCETQIRPFPHPRSPETARALALFRGCHAGVSYGEGFHIIRMTSPPEHLGQVQPSHSSP